MINYNEDFLVINELAHKEPRYVAEISFDDANTDTIHVTSHHDCDVPDGATVIYGALNSLSGTSQKIDPIKAVATIGDLSFSAVDLSELLTSTIYSRLYPTPEVAVDGLRHKRVQLSIGFKGLPWDSYEIPAGGTQIIDGIDYDISNSAYEFKCSDIQRSIRKTILEPKTSNLLNTITETQTQIPARTTEEFIPVFHGTSYTDSPSDTVGYIDLNGEAIAWREKLETAIQNTDTDVSFSGNTITSTLIDLSVYSDKQQIVISGSAGNSTVLTINGTPTANNIVVNETLATETAGPSITILADIQYYNCTRGALATRPLEHVIADNTDVERRTEIKEIIYLELPAVKCLYALLTGILYGDSATLPDHWHLNISTAFVETSAFIGIGTDWWNTTNDDVGVPSRFQYLGKTDGKKFIERELLLMLGAFMPVTSTGQLSLRRMTYVGGDSAYHHILDESNVISIGKLQHKYKEVYNQFLFRWNWDPIKKSFSRNELLVDNDSIGTHKDTDILEMPFKGMHGATYTTVRAHIRRDSARDRYIGPPERITVVCSPENNKIEVGDIVRLQLANLQDFVSGGSINRSFEVQRVSINWTTGAVTLSLFGSTQRPTPLPTLASSTVVPDANYTTLGVDISTETTGTNSSGTWIIDTDSILYGSGTMGSEEYTTGTVSATNGSKIVTGASTVWNLLDNTNIEISGVTYNIDTIDSDTQITLIDNYAGSTGSGKTYKLWGAIYYWDGDITIAATKELEIFDNVRIRYTGEFTNNGIINGVGNGRNGTASVGPDYNLVPGEIGLTGKTKAAGGHYHIDSVTGSGGVTGSFPAEVTVGVNIGLPSLHVEYNGTDIVGLDAIDFRATSGGCGGRYFENRRGREPTVTPGATGGASGAALVLEGRGVNTGSASDINLSGGAGPIGTLGGLYNNHISGSAAGGSPSPLLVILDGSIATTSEVLTHYTANLGDSTIPSGSTRLENGAAPIRTDHPGYVEDPQKSGLYREIKLADYSAPIEDVPEISENPTAINLAEGAASKQSLNLAAIEVSVDAPVGSTSYYGSAIYARETGTEAWIRITTVIGAEEKVVQVPNYRASYDFKAAPISIAGVESESFIADSIAITGISKAASFTVGSHIRGGQTDYDAGNGFWIGDDGGTWKFSIGNSAANKLIFDGTNLEVTGKITASSGAIGGWTIGANDFRNTADTVSFDSAASSITVSELAAGGGHKVVISPSGIVATDTVLGTTFNLPTDGTAPTFASGIINSTTFNITSSGILETSSTAGDGTGSGAGVRINNLGVKGWEASNSTPNFFLDAATGKITAIDGDFSGTITASSFVTAASGKRIEINPSADNEIHFYGDRGDATITELATIGIKTSGPDTIILDVGGNVSGDSNVAIRAKSYSANAINAFTFSGAAITATSSSGRGVSAASTSSYAIHGQSASNIAVYGVSSSSWGVYGFSTTGIGGVFQCGSGGLSPLKIVPKANTTDHSSGAMGHFYVRSDGVLRFHNGTAWKTVTVV